MAGADYSALAGKAIAGDRLTRDECLSVLRAPDSDLLAVLDAAYEVRRHFCGNTVHLHVLMNAKSGACQEDCGYCSQSRVSTADIDVYPMVDEEQMLDGARRAKAALAKRFCIVIANRGPSWPDVRRLTSAVRRIREEVDIGICVSVGLLSEEKARALKEAGVEQLNHNLNTSERYYPEICSTHTYADRIATLAAARSAGLKLCTGAIFGMGETDDDVIDLLLELRELDVQSIPVNFLIPIDGTPLEGVSVLTPNQCLRILCLARLLNPRQEIRVSGGREVHLRSLQPLALYAANSVFVDGYLTTPGQPHRAAWQMIRDMGFELEAHLPDGVPEGAAEAAMNGAAASRVAH
jgi:biotin synthase